MRTPMTYSSTTAHLPAGRGPSEARPALVRRALRLEYMEVSSTAKRRERLSAGNSRQHPEDRGRL